MPEVILGVLVLIGLLFLGQMFAGANPKSLAKGLRTTGAILMGLGALALLTVDRVGVAMLLGSMAWGLYTGGHIWPGGWPYFGRGGSGGGTASGAGGAKPGAGRTPPCARPGWNSNSITRRAPCAAPYFKAVTRIARSSACPKARYEPSTARPHPAMPKPRACSKPISIAASALAGAERGRARGRSRRKAARVVVAAAAVVRGHGPMAACRATRLMPFWDFSPALAPMTSARLIAS